MYKVHKGLLNHFIFRMVMFPGSFRNCHIANEQCRKLTSNAKLNGYDSITTNVTEVMFCQLFPCTTTVVHFVSILSKYLEIMLTKPSNNVPVKYEQSLHEACKYLQAIYTTTLLSNTVESRCPVQ